jgi:hypothetical protein
LQKQAEKQELESLKAQEAAKAASPQPPEAAAEPAVEDEAMNVQAAADKAIADEPAAMDDPGVHPCPSASLHGALNLCMLHQL